MSNGARRNAKRRAVALGVAILAGIMMSATVGHEMSGTQEWTFDADGANAAEGAHDAGYQRMLAQQPMIEAANRVRGVVDAGDQRGFAGISLENDQIALWWKGQLPDHVRDAVTRAEATAPIRVAAAKHSLAELRSAATKVRARIDAEHRSAVRTVRIPPDGRGLELVARPDSGLRLGEGHQRAGVSVTIVEETEPKRTSREDDQAPRKPVAPW